jgi:hypothetical protein
MIVQLFAKARPTCWGGNALGNIQLKRMPTNANSASPTMIATKINPTLIQRLSNLILAQTVMPSATAKPRKLKMNISLPVGRLSWRLRLLLHRSALLACRLQPGTSSLTLWVRTAAHKIAGRCGSAEDRCYLERATGGRARAVVLPDYRRGHCGRCAVAVVFLSRVRAIRLGRFAHARPGILARRFRASSHRYSCRRCSPNAPFARLETLTAERP